MDYGRKSELYLNSSGPVWTNVAGRDGIRVQREHLDQVRWQESRVGSGSHRPFFLLGIISSQIVSVMDDSGLIRHPTRPCSHPLVVHNTVHSLHCTALSACSGRSLSISPTSETGRVDSGPVA
ncbi:hypothetical protein FOTG_01013 [Fusarium oxysporum f. sp. vasinfectum 25433]|uniref:Uncharacterized protein n=1 Tax=Fusarium oxysporum f. sp. vasinfectum 25433 TaxID=1089449 RepID=X0MGA9_FUSOX|nr:hypothetical protein FOTG_01013 [Fusarium oxysporum f. sp. vasinfectum 25433]